jgi:hypothetical protein
MEGQLRVFAWLVAGGAFFALLGGAFGALSGATYWRSGRSSGTVFGLTVARAFARASGGELSRGAQGALVGAVDGIVFLGLIGTAVGAFLASRGGRADGALVAAAAGAVVALAGSAALFGLLAYGMIRVGVWSVAAVFVAGTLGAAGGAYLAGLPGLLLGAVGGLFLGTTFGLLTQRYAPRFIRPRIGKVEGRPPRRRPTTDFTCPEDLE